MPGLYSRVKTWVKEKIYYQDLNAEFDNIIANSDAAHLGGFSATVTQMRQTQNPGAQGSEVLAIATSDEVQQIRYVLNRIIGLTYWYDAPDLSISQINALLSLSGFTQANRLDSGRNTGSSNQALALTAHATLARAVLKATTTPLVYHVGNVPYTIAADTTSPLLPLAPSSSNTCIVNGPVVDPLTQGELGTVISVHGMGAAISNYIGKFAAFSLGTAGNNDYFIARVDSIVQLSNAYRGYFFDSSDTPISRGIMTVGATITLLQLTYLFVTTTGTIDICSNAPYYDFTAPTAATSGDYWFDLNNLVWNKYISGVWTLANATLLGVTAQNSTKCVGTRTIEYFSHYADDNTVLLRLQDGSKLEGQAIGERVSVGGRIHYFQENRPQWTSSGQFAPGVTLDANTDYYCYISDKGQMILDTIAPYDRSQDLFGFYHPYNLWRAVGSTSTDSGGLFIAARSYGFAGYKMINGSRSLMASPDFQTTASIDGRDILTTIPGGAIKSIVVRGTIDASGAITVGEGFTTAVLSTTTIQINFNTAFIEAAVVVVTPSAFGFMAIASPTTTSVVVASSITNPGFHFIAMGHIA